MRVRVDELGQCRPPLRPGRHAHESFLLCCLPQSGGSHEVGGTRHEIEAGDVLTIPVALAHDLGDDGSAASLAISFMPDGVTSGLLRDPVLVGDARRYGSRRTAGPGSTGSSSGCATSCATRAPATSRRRAHSSR